jgi:uncharacterized protein
VIDTSNLPAAPPTVARWPQKCFLFLCHDADGSAALRARDLDGHLAHVEANWQRYVICGPMRQPGGEALVGSMFLTLAESEDDAWALMNQDPYFTNGQYARVEVMEQTLSLGLFLGGKIWESADAIRHRAAGGPTG